MCFLRSKDGQKESQFILAAGRQNVMFKIDVQEGRIVDIMPTKSEYTLMKHSNYICAATSTGSVDFLDPETLQVKRSWQAHPTSINDMDVKKDFLVTCGFATRMYGPPALEQFAKVFDLKTMEQLPPIPLPGGAAYIRIHPKMSTTSLIGSLHGQLQIVDLMNPNTSNLHHLSLSSTMKFLAISSSSNFWVIAELDNTIHLWGTMQHVQFNDDSKETEFADNPAPVQSFDVDDDL